VQTSSQNVTTNKPTLSFLQAGCPSCRPTNSVRALKGVSGSSQAAVVPLTSQLHTIFIIAKCSTHLQSGTKCFLNVDENKSVEEKE